MCGVQIAALQAVISDEERRQTEASQKEQEVQTKLMELQMVSVSLSFFNLSQKDREVLTKLMKLQTVSVYLLSFFSNLTPIELRGADKAD